MSSEIPSPLKPRFRFAYQCIRCGWVIENKSAPEKCPDCECVKFNFINLRYGLKAAGIDRPTPESVAHLKKKVENCFNYDLDPVSQMKTYHKLKLVREVTKQLGPDPSASHVLIRQVCEECGLLYTQRAIPFTRTDKLQALGINLEDLR